jgi:hypothetical protein
MLQSCFADARQDNRKSMPPRAPTVWTTTAVRSERFRQRIDERHRELSVQAKARGRAYRRSRAEPFTEEAIRLRADFLASLGRLTTFESASVRLARCRYEAQLTVHTDDLSRDYFELWQLIARRGSDQTELEERGAERMDYFAMQLGRLEGIADALILAGRNVRLFPLPPLPWISVA